ncbi:MAG: hypothetical protein QOF92_944 [Pseudonocardiales bacterium]|jgi:hypothetical protein|nr:hypothetical protein [Pseudonocardiales bacterium]MDT4928077.1 hypothetical protein [Pseudonocardiales bacterium]
MPGSRRTCLPNAPSTSKPAGWDVLMLPFADGVEHVGAVEDSQVRVPHGEG